MPKSTSRQAGADKNGKPSRIIKAENHAAAEAADREAKAFIKRNGKASWFTSFAQKTAYLAGKPMTFLLAAATIVVWAATGPLFGYSDTWQLVINTGTTIVTFIMVFLIQSTQNRDAEAVHLNLDELIRAMQGARNALVDLENLPAEELEALAQQFAKLRERISDDSKKRPVQ